MSGKCYDPDGNLVGTSCFDIPTATSDVISYYPSAYGFTLSTAMKGHPDFSTMYWEIAPPLTPGGPMARQPSQQQQGGAPRQRRYTRFIPRFMGTRTANA